MNYCYMLILIPKLTYYNLLLSSMSLAFSLFLYFSTVILLIINKRNLFIKMGGCALPQNKQSNQQSSYEGFGTSKNQSFAIEHNLQVKIDSHQPYVKTNKPKEQIEYQLCQNKIVFTLGQSIEQKQKSSDELKQDIDKNKKDSHKNQEQIIKKTQVVIQQVEFEWDRSTSHANCYQFNSNGKIKTLRYLDTEFNRCQITAKEPFPQKGIHIFTVKIVKQRQERAICIGLLAQSRKNMVSSGDIGDNDSLGYWNFNQKECQIDINGVMKQNKSGYNQYLACQVGDQVEFKLDIDEKQLTITRRQDKKMFQHSQSIKLPQNLIKNRIYAFVSMIQKDDQIEVSYSRQLNQ